MKAPALLLLFCLGMLPALSRAHLQSGLILAGQEPHMRELLDYYKNGSLKCKTIAIYNGEGSEEKTITEAYRKDGARRYRSVMNGSDLLQYTKYDRQGNMIFERSYCYSDSGYLLSVETRRPNGERQTWTQPPPEPPVTCYAIHY